MPTPAVPFSGPAPLQLRPFRAVRYDAERVGDPSERLAPPYDDLHPAQVRAPTPPVPRGATAVRGRTAGRRPRTGALAATRRTPPARAARTCTSTSNSVAPGFSNVALSATCCCHARRDNCCRTKTCRTTWPGSAPPICQAFAPNWSHCCRPTEAQRRRPHISWTTPPAVRRSPLPGPDRSPTYCGPATIPRNSRSSPVACPSGRHSSPTATTATPPASS